MIPLPSEIFSPLLLKFANFYVGLYYHKYTEEVEWLSSMGYLGLFISSLLGATILPLSSEVVLLALLASTNIDPVLAIIAATIGNWAGGLVSYYMGYLGRWDWLERYFGVKHESLEAQRAVIRRWGAWVAIMTWMPIIGDLLAIALGFYRIDLWRTAIFMLIGRAIRYIIWAALYYLVTT